MCGKNKLHQDLKTNENKKVELYLGQFYFFSELIHFSHRTLLRLSFVCFPKSFFGNVEQKMWICGTEQLEPILQQLLGAALYAK